MKHSRGVKRRTWTAEASVDYVDRVTHGAVKYGLTALSALDYLRGAWPTAYSMCRAKITAHLEKREAERANERST